MCHRDPGADCRACPNRPVRAIRLLSRLGMQQIADMLPGLKQSQGPIRELSMFSETHLDWPALAVGLPGLRYLANQGFSSALEDAGALAGFTKLQVYHQSTGESKCIPHDSAVMKLWAAPCPSLHTVVFTQYGTKSGDLLWKKNSDGTWRLSLVTFAYVLGKESYQNVDTCITPLTAVA